MACFMLILVSIQLASVISMFGIFTIHNITSVKDSLLEGLNALSYRHCDFVPNENHRLNNLLTPLLPMSTLQSLVYHIATLKGSDVDQTRHSVN